MIFEKATPLERHRLETLFGPNSRGFDGDGQNQAGPLFGVPEEETIRWAAEDPKNRSAFLADFYPILGSRPDECAKWHPTFEKLIAAFVGTVEFTQNVGRRFRPRSWSGSIVPHLEVYLAPLTDWFEHERAELSHWARQMHRSLTRRITAGSRGSLCVTTCSRFFAHLYQYLGSL